MENIYSLLIYCICGMLITFIVFSIFKLQQYKSMKTLIAIPQPYRTLYNLIKQIPILEIICNKYEIDLFLISGSNILGSVEVAVGVAVLPAIMALIIIASFTFVDVWYYAAVIAFFGILIPYFTITGFVDSKAKDIRYRLIPTYRSAETYLSDNMQVISITQEIASNSSGPIKRLYTTFNREYQIDRDLAYENFAKTAGDKFSTFFIEMLQRYEMHGINPGRSLSDMIDDATRHYDLMYVNKRGYKNFKITAAALLGMDIFLTQFTVTERFSFLSYIGGIAVLIALVLAMFYERQY